MRRCAGMLMGLFVAGMLMAGGGVAGADVHVAVTPGECQAGGGTVFDHNGTPKCVGGAHDGEFVTPF